MLFIPHTVREWHERFLYNEKHPHVMPPFDEVPERYRGFERYYMGYVHEFGAMVKRESGV